MIVSVDIGGTKVALALWQHQNGSLGLLDQKRYPTEAHADLGGVIDTFINDCGDVRANAVGLGVAGPVSGDTAQVTNLPWRISADDIRGRFDCQYVSIVNDLVAHAHGLTSLDASGMTTLRSGTDQIGNKVLIAAGTGLGEAILGWNGRDHLPICSEGGHSSFSPTNEQEARLLRFLWQEHAHVSFERVVSGKFGFRNLYRFLASEGEHTTSDTVRKAVETHEDAGALVQDAAESGDELAAATMRLFARLYGSEAANLALKAKAVGGVYIGGGIAPKAQSWLDSEDFYEGFNSKGRFRAILEEMPIHLVTDPLNGMRGAAIAAMKVTNA